MDLVIGSTGSVGSAVVDELTGRGQRVRALIRDPRKAKRVFKREENIELLQGSAEDIQLLNAAFDGVQRVFNCLNLPYPEWEKLPAIHRKILDAARQASARMVFPGNVYIYGHAQAERVSEGHPRNPCSKKGMIRLKLEDMFMESSRKGDVPTVIVRFPDFYGPNSPSIADGIFRAAIAGKTARWYGYLDAIHEFIFIKDAGKAMVTASERADAYGQDFNVPGPKPISAREWISMVFKQVGREPRMRGTSRLTMRFFGMFNKMAREFAEMQYLTEEPLILDGTKFTKFFGMQYPSTDYVEGIRQTLEWVKTHAW
jgi:nucleoside-diphosphate-sugar epimerase